MERDEFRDDEEKLKHEIKELKEKLSYLRKTRITTEEFEDGIKDVRQLSSKGVDKNNSGEIPIANMHEEDSCTSIDKEIEYIQTKKNMITDVMQSYYTNGDGRFKNISQEQSNNKTTILPFINKIPQISTLFERVSSELQVQKFKVGEEYNDEKDKAKKFSHKVKKNKDLIQLYNRVITAIEKKNEELIMKDSFTEEKQIKEKCISEKYNFDQNTLDIITTAGLAIPLSQEPNGNDFIKRSSINLRNGSEKIQNGETKRGTSKVSSNVVIDMFNSNIRLALQNNYGLYFKINKLITPFYNTILGKASVYRHEEDFNLIKEKIKNYKDYGIDNGTQGVRKSENLSNEQLEEGESEEEYN